MDRCPLPILMIISAYQHTSEMLAQELTQLCGADYTFLRMSLDQSDTLFSALMPLVDTDCALVVYSSETVRLFVERRWSPVCPTLVTQRNFNMNRLPELVSLASGTEVYVFGSNQSASQELIEELHRVGITHLDLRSYYPGIPLPAGSLVVTPGKHLPQMSTARRVIDLEFQTLSIATVFQAFILLRLPREKFSLLENWYHRELQGINRYQTALHTSIAGILESIREGILCTDGEGRVLFCNKLFLDLAGLRYVDVMNRRYDQIPAPAELADILQCGRDLEAEVVECQGRKLLVHRQCFSEKGEGFVLSLQDVTRLQELESSVRKKLSEKGFLARYTMDSLIGKSAAIQEKIWEARKVAATDYTVLLTGDNGTGKEMFAQAIHNSSSRAGAPFVAVNLASLSDNIIESEIFGYEGGAFTGALRNGKAGLFEIAHNGTIFIDEIGDVSPHIQQRLLRVLQEKVVMRVGGSRLIPINVRVIAATNRDLLQLVRQGKFRMDLYYRLNVLHLHIPPLSQRTEDIPLFLEHFFQEIGSRKRVGPDALTLLHQYPWPGNVRELQNLVYYLDTLCSGEEIRAEDLPPEYRQGSVEPDRSLWERIAAENGQEIVSDLVFLLQELERAKRNGTALGRTRLARLSERRAEGPLTPEQLRTRLKKLERYGLVQVGRTRQGTQITSLGIQYLNQHQKENT